MLYKMQKMDKLLVWLDNDSQYVVNQAKHIARTALLFGTKSSGVIELGRDPKYEGGEYIRRVLDGQH